MGNSTELLQEEELEFLLNETDGSSVSADGAPEDQLPGDGEVTMRGDLDKIELADIFQTLAMSKMEGQLRVRNVVETHELFFRDGYVRSIPPKRTEIKRIGQRLLHAGLLTIEQLRTSLLVQKKKRHRHLGEILVEEGYVTQDDIDDVFHNQVQEDLFALFTWRHGAFEFYRGPCRDPIVMQRLEKTPRFEVNGVLLEVARRGDEWQRVIDVIGDLDEIFQPIEGVEPEEPFGEDYETVMDGLDGKRNIRALADQTALGLFFCGCIVRDLATGGFIEPISSEDALTVAEEQCESGDLKIATLTYHMLRKRAEAHPAAIALPLAKGLQRCGESRWAGGVLVATGRAESDPIEALKIARLARKHASRSAEVLQFLHALLESTGADPQELIEVTAELADAYAQDGEIDDAIVTVRQLERLAPGSPVALNRKARILARFGFEAEAVEALEQLAAHFAGESDRERLAAVYEHILKIDSRRRDIAKQLRALRSNKNVVRARVAAGIVLALGIGTGGWFHISSSNEHSRLVTIRDAAIDLVGRGATEAARAKLFESGIDFESHELFSDVVMRIARAELEKQTEAKLRRDEKVAATIARADEAIADADLKAAFAIYTELAALGQSEKAIHDIVALRAESIHTRLTAVEAQLRENMPVQPNLLHSARDHESIVAATRDRFRASDRALAETMLDPKIISELATHATKEQLQQLAKSAETVRKMFAECDAILDDHQRELDRTRTAKRLTPLFDAARRHENDYEFDKALDAYRTLYRDHPEDDDLKASFKERVQRFETIRKHLGVIRTATQRGDFAAAQGQLRELKAAFPTIPFDNIAKLPLRVITQPAGARVFVDDVAVGTSPAHTSYHPGHTVKVRVELDGFVPEETEFTGDLYSTVRSLLAQRSSWSLNLRATTESGPAVAGTRAFFADRSGNVICIDTARQAEAWRVATRDMSGLLPRPCTTEDGSLIVASIDGNLRCFSQTDGTLRWTVAGLPCEVAPVAIGSSVLVATTSGALIGVATTDGARQFSIELDANASVNLITCGGTDKTPAYGIAATASGKVVAVDPDHRSVAWTFDSGNGIFSTPVAAAGRVCIVDDAGTLTALDSASGARAWTQRGLLDVELPLGAAGGQVFAVGTRTIHRFQLADGKDWTKGESDVAISAPPALVGPRLYIGREDGTCEVRDAVSLLPIYVLHGPAKMLAPVAAIGDAGATLATFADGTIQWYAPMGFPR